MTILEFLRPAAFGGARTGTLLVAAIGSAFLAGCAGPRQSTGFESHVLPAHAASDAPVRERHQEPATDLDVPVEGVKNFLLGVGFTGSPGTSLLGGQADIYLTDEWAVGPMLQLGLSGNKMIIAPSFNVKRVFEMQTAADTRWRPFVQAGVGFAFLYQDGRAGDNDDLGFLLNGGGGVEVFLDNGLSLASTVMVNVLPDKVLGESSFLSWQIVQMQFRF